MLDQEIKGRPVNVEQCNRIMFHTDLVSVPWGSMVHIMSNSIRDLDDSHRKCTLITFRHYGYDQRVRKMILTIYTLDGRRMGITGVGLSDSPKNQASV